MLCKFIGAQTHEATLDLFEKVVVGGSFKFTAALRFNDPFEFKFHPVRPSSRRQLQTWHDTHDPTRSQAEIEQAWRTSRRGRGWNYLAGFSARAQLLQSCYVSCFTRKATSHLMWAHYSQAHTGFAVLYDDALVDTLHAVDGFESAGPVTYRAGVPRVRHFVDSPQTTMQKVLFTKSGEWRYEEEFRVVFTGNPGQDAIYLATDPLLVKGVILGGRANEALRTRALELRNVRPELEVSAVASRGWTYDLTAERLENNVWRTTQIL